METKIVTKESGNTKQVITYRYVKKILLSCTIATHTVQYDTCGNYVGVFKESYEAFGGDCSVAGEGGLLISVRREMTEFGDCPANW